MAPSDGWYLVGPLLAVALAGFAGFARLPGLRWTEQADDPPRELSGLAIFTDPEDYGLLCVAAVADEPVEAAEVRLLLADAGIRATQATRRDGRVVVLVFGEELEEARRLVGDSPAL